MRCYFIGGSLDGMIKEINEPPGHYRVPVLTHNMAMVVDPEVSHKAVRYGMEEYSLLSARIAGRYYHLNRAFQEIALYLLVHQETGQ